MSEPVFLFDGGDPEVKNAHKAAQETFKYFWRELHWERRRIVPGLDLSIIKLPFTDGPRADGNPEVEHMWCGDVEFDGEFLTGVLGNQPNWLTSVNEGDTVRVPFSQLEDWLISFSGKAYGGHMVNLMRSKMGMQERDAHDQAWGLDFGNPRKIRLELREEKNKGKGFFAKLFGKKEQDTEASTEFRDHPMCVNTLQMIETQIQADSSFVTGEDENGWTLLHAEALAGNMGVVRLLVKYGADTNAKTPEGKTAASLARTIGWNEIAACLEGGAR